MSYDLMLFDNKNAPQERSLFMKWFYEKTNWSEDLDYDSPEHTTPNLNALFIELITNYPPLNGKLAPDDSCWDNVDWCEQYEDKCTDYSIGKDIIYCAFAWSEATEAYSYLKKLAKKHNVSLFNVSDKESAIEYNESLPDDNVKDKRPLYQFDWSGSIYTDFGDGGLNTSVLGDAINGFSPEFDDYIILSPTPAIKKSIYLQAHSPKVDGKIQIETRFEYDDETFKHYRYETEDTNEVYWFFANYWSKQEIPNISKWTDITNEFI